MRRRNVSRVIDLTTGEDIALTARRPDLRTHPIILRLIDALMLQPGVDRAMAERVAASTPRDMRQIIKRLGKSPGQREVVRAARELLESERN
jgi:hypothetical protein